MAVSQSSRAETPDSNQLGGALAPGAGRASVLGAGSARAIGEGDTRAFQSAEDKLQRIDSRHQSPRPTACILPLERADEPVCDGEETASGGEKTAAERSEASPRHRRCPDPSAATTHSSRDSWLRLQAADLIDRLQTWADQLDQHETQLRAREASLNTRAALQDQRERRFRMQQQEATLELEEQERSIEQLRRRIEAQARRLAFA